MSRWLGWAVKLFVVLFVALLLEACILRDPWVELGNGYNIGAVSRGSPCHLTYWQQYDPRPFSGWYSDAHDGVYFLFRVGFDEHREYTSEAAWRASARELGARPARLDSALDDILGFACDKRYAIGCATHGGYFLLDKDENTLETWPTREEWLPEVAARTRLNPARLKNPKAWHVQYRPPEFWVIMGGYFAVATAVLALARSRRGAALPRAGPPSHSDRSTVE